MDTALHTAWNRLSQALDRLEATASAVTESAAHQANETDAAFSDITSQNRFLQEENQRLSNQLQALQKEFLALQEAANLTINRLDDSVNSLDRMLEGAH